MPSVFPSLVLPEKGSTCAPRLGHHLVDDYLASVAARLRLNSTLAVAYDLKVFFTVVAKDPADVGAADVVAFVRAQRTQGADGAVVSLGDGSAGLALSTVRRRLSSVSSLYRDLLLVGAVSANGAAGDAGPLTGHAQAGGAVGANGAPPAACAGSRRRHCLDGGAADATGPGHRRS